MKERDSAHQCWRPNKNTKLQLQRKHKSSRFFVRIGLYPIHSFIHTPLTENPDPTPFHMPKPHNETIPTNEPCSKNPGTPVLRKNCLDENYAIRSFEPLLHNQVVMQEYK